MSASGVSPRLQTSDEALGEETFAEATEAINSKAVGSLLSAMHRTAAH